MGLRVLVFGGRDFDNRTALWLAMDELRRKRGVSCVIHGACHLGGADRLAGEWAAARGIPVEAYPVERALDGPWPGAGPMRNARMLANSRPDWAVQFPGCRGTATMRRLCDNRKPERLKVWEPMKERKDA